MVVTILSVLGGAVIASFFSGSEILARIKNVDKFWKQYFSFADQETVDKRRKGLRIKKAGHSPRDDKGVEGSSVIGFQGEGCLFENLKNVGIVVFKRNGKSDNIKIIKRSF